MTTEGDRLGRESADLAEELPTQRLAQEAKSLLQAFAEKVLASVGEKVSDKVNEVSHGLLEKAGGEDGGGPGVKAAFSGVKALTEGKGPMRAMLGAAGTGIKEKVKKIFGGGGKGKGKKAKITNIVETIDVGVPLRLAYDQWTQYEDFPSFMKKVESVEQPVGGEVQLEGAGLLVPPLLGGDHLGAGARRPHHLAVEGSQGVRRRRGVLLGAGAEPHPDLPGDGVPPAGAVRAHGQPLAGPGPSCPPGVQALPAARDGARDPRPGRDRGLAGRDPRR